MTGFAKTATILILLSLLRNGNPAKILGLMGCASHSHHLWNKVLFDALSERGHTLTVVSVDADNSKNPNQTFIHLEATYKAIEEHYKFVDPSSFTGPFSNVRMLYDYQLVTCKGILQSTGFQDAFKLEDKFDLILYDFATGPCLLRLIQKYPDIPVVGVSAFKLTTEILDVLGGHSYPAYIPHFATQFDVPMNFWRRLYNTILYAVDSLYRKYISDSIINGMVAKHIPDQSSSLQTLYKQMKIALVNTYPSMDNVQSLPPNIIEIGGLHIKEPQPLPKDIEEFIEAGELGAAFISFGTNLKVEQFGEETLQTFIKVINRLPKYNFLWKIDREGLIKNPPKNLMARKWFPQNDILAHPKIKGFLSHAGGLSTQEATWHGVPVIAMPFYMDQLHNAYYVEKNGYGKVLDYKNITEQTLFPGIFGVLFDDTYRLRMQQSQKQFRDRQNKPLDTAVWWVEYILRNPEVDHLISSSRDMSYFVANSIDVIFIAVALLIMFLINTWIVLRNIKGTWAKPKTKSVIKNKTQSQKKVKKN